MKQQGKRLTILAAVGMGLFLLFTSLNPVLNPVAAQTWGVDRGDVGHAHRVIAFCN